MFPNSQDEITEEIAKAWISFNGPGCVRAKDIELLRVPPLAKIFLYPTQHVARVMEPIDFSIELQIESQYCLSLRALNNSQDQESSFYIAPLTMPVRGVKYKIYRLENQEVLIL